MKYRNLGSSGVKVSTVCLGTMTFGDADENSFMHKVSCDESTSHKILDRAVDAGVNFIDTADIYGQDGLSERVIGNWFESAGKRDEVVIATKFRFSVGEGANRTGGSRYRIMRTVEDSLRRLKTDRIDLYQIHMQDITAPEEETLRALDDLVHQGKVLYIGCSNYAGYRMSDSLWTSATKNLASYVTLQARYSLVSREVEREHVPLCVDKGVGIITWSPLAGGFLTGKYKRDQGPPDGSRLAKWKERYDGFDTERHWRILDAASAVSEDVGASVAQVSLAWLLHKPAVSSVIFGARTVKQLEDNLAAAELELSDSHMDALDDASAFDVGYPYDFIKNIQGRW